MPSELAAAICKHQAAFGLELSSESLRLFDLYYELLLEHNPILHLTGPMNAEEFAIRHILESLMLLKYLPEKARFADVGSGGGLPSIPCLLVREDLSAVMIESKAKKAEFLNAAAEALGIRGRVNVVNQQFEEALGLSFDAVTCRALDKLTQKLPKLVKWGRGSEMLLFGGPLLADKLAELNLRFEAELLPLSQRRYLYVVGK